MPRRKNTPEPSVQSSGNQNPGNVNPGNVNPANQNPSGYYCYIGPTIRSVLQANTIVIGPLEAMLKRAEKAIEKAPSVRHLIVPGTRLQEARNHIRNNINPEAMLYRRVLKELKEE